MSDKDSVQNVIDSYRKRRQNTTPFLIGGLAIVLVAVGIVVLVVWITGPTKPAIAFLAISGASTSNRVISGASSFFCTILNNRNHRFSCKILLKITINTSTIIYLLSYNPVVLKLFLQYFGQNPCQNRKVRNSLGLTP